MTISTDQDSRKLTNPTMGSLAIPIDEVPEKDILSFFTGQLKTASPQIFLDLLCAFFLETGAEPLPEVMRQVSRQILITNQQEKFVRLLKYCCYHFIGHCLEQNKPLRITDLVHRLIAPSEMNDGRSPLVLKKACTWVQEFTHNDEGRILRALAPPSEMNPHRWGDRYLAFLLFAQSVNSDLPLEQRRVSAALYQLLHNRFRFRLVMYLSTKGKMTAAGRATQNPTLIEDVTLGLIHRLVVKKKPSYLEMAAQLSAQLKELTLADWQSHFMDYLFWSMPSPRRLRWLPEKLDQYLAKRYPHRSTVALDPAMISSACRVLIDYLLNPCHMQDLSHPLPVLMVQREYLTLSILLFKLVLISPENYGALLKALGNLLGQYQDDPKDECQWLKGFFETIQVILALVAPIAPSPINTVAVSLPKSSKTKDNEETFLM